MIGADLKRCLGQMIKGVQVVAATHEGRTRAYTSHWVTQVSFAEPIVLASISPRHDTHPLIIGSGRFGVTMLAGDQVAEGQYFSYPGRKFHHVAAEYLEEVTDDAGGRWTIVPNGIAWIGCSVIEVQSGRYDHDLVFARVLAHGEGRLGAPPLLYSARHGWRVTGVNARERGTSVRDQLLARLGDRDGDTDGAGRREAGDG
jgi:flavin reductase (DIM6/NTAB) family NADH-FMN oxidoreductase RutF